MVDFDLIKILSFSKYFLSIFYFAKVCRDIEYLALQ